MGNEANGTMSDEHMSETNLTWTKYVNNEEDVRPARAVVRGVHERTLRLGGRHSWARDVILSPSVSGLRRRRGLQSVDGLRGLVGSEILIAAVVYTVRATVKSYAFK